MFPYNTSYFGLAFPLAGTLGILLLEYRLLDFRSNWILIGFALIAGYAAFIGIALSSRLDSDDRLILRAIWSQTVGRFVSGGSA
jgi:hypothetical protein